MFADLLRERIGGRVVLSGSQVSQLLAHYELLLKWNRRLSLTSIESPAEIVERHYCESLFAGSLLPEGRLTVVDVGSGAGFPGVPIAILRPESEFVLVESHQRKAVFLMEACRGLKNVRVLALRAEAVVETFDWMVSRAVSYADLGSVLRVAPNVMLLGGEEAPGKTGDIRWGQPAQLPWGKRRYVYIGQRSGE